jgi:hypothetical protein
MSEAAAVPTADTCDHDDVETRTDDDLRITYVCRTCGAVT